MKNNLFQKSIKSFWIYSYAVILIIFTCVSGALFISYEKSLNKQVLELNRYVSETIATNINGILIDTRNIYSRMLLDSEIDGVLRIDSAEEYASSTAAWKMVDNIKAYSQMKNAANIYMYIPATDSVLCSAGIYNSKKFFSRYFHEGAITYSKWLKLHKRTDSLREYMSTQLSLNGGESVECFLSTSYAFVHGIKDIVIGIAIPKYEFFRAVDSFEWLERCNVYISDQGKTFRFTSDKNVSEESDSIVTEKAVSIDTSIMNITVITSKKLLMRHIKTLNLILMITMLVAFFALLAVIFYTIRKNYGSIASIFRRFQLNPTVDDYDSLMENIDKWNEKNKYIARENIKKNHLVKFSVLSQLLRQSYSEEAKVLSRYGFNLEGEYFCAVALQIYDSSRLYNGRSEMPAYKRFQELRFILANVFEELFATDFCRGYLTDFDDHFICLVNLNSNQSNQKDKLLKLALEGADFVYKHFGIDMAVAVSDIHPRIENAPLATFEASKAIEYLLLYDMGNGIIYSDIKDSSPNRSYIFSKKTAGQLSEAISEGNISEAQFIINEIMSGLRSAGDISMQQVQFIMIDIVCCIFKSTENEAIPQISDMLFKINNLKKMEEYLLKLTEKACMSQASENKLKELSFSESIMNYVLQNYRNPDLNMAMIGYHFALTPAYISKSFKAEYGEALLDYIHRYRLSKAKDLMRENKLSIREIALETGYSHIRTFNRIFKRYEGVTPTDFIDSL